MTFDLCKMHKHYAANKTNVSPVYACPVSFIHSQLVAENNCFSAKIPVFWMNYGPWWPLTFAKGNQYIHFWKAPITYYHCAKFQDSVINSAWEKRNVNVFGPFFQWLLPLMTSDLCERQSNWAFLKALIAYYHCGKFQVPVFNSVWEKCNVKVFWRFSH